MRDSTVLPDLRMLPTENLIPHEEVDPRRVERLCQRLQAERLLKNPPVVASIPDTERYHVVSGLDVQEFEDELTQVTGLRLEQCSLSEARQALESCQAAAYIVCADGVRKALNTREVVSHDTWLLNRLVQAYKGKADIYRASNDIWEIQAPYYPHITALVIFPRLTPQDIIEAVQSGEKVPTGITRHIIPQRALNINISLEILEADLPEVRKDAWLQEWLMERMAANAIRYYSESTFSFNE
ncbi:MAG: hypothetical protein P8074_12930 [Anaerolineales bacterium]